MRWALALWLVAAVAGGASGGELRLEPRGVRGSALVVDVVARDLRRVGSFDVRVAFDPDRLAPPARSGGRPAWGGMIAENATEPGRYRLAVIVPAGASGDGALATLHFPLRTSRGAPTSETALGLEVQLTDVDGAPLPARARGTRVSLDAPAPDAPASDPGAAEVGGGKDVAQGDGADAAAEDVAADGEDVAADGEDVAADGEDVAADGEDVAADGEDVAADGEDVAADGEDVAADGEADALERRRGHREARLAGYGLYVVFEPEQTFPARDGATQIVAIVRAFERGVPLELRPGDVALSGRGVEVTSVEPLPGTDGLACALRVDAAALPARLSVRAFGLDEERLIPVYPRADVDFDGSGDLSARDHALLLRRLGARRGGSRYERRYDLLEDGVIDAADHAAFEWNLVEAERPRRLRDALAQRPDAPSPGGAPAEGGPARRAAPEREDAP